MNQAGAPGSHAARLTDLYSNGIVSKNLPTERERLRLLERDSDPQTMEILQGLPVNASWRCLDLGAGAGSIAYWLADRCRDGHVVAADIEVRFLDRARPGNLEVWQFDVGRDGLDERWIAQGTDMQWARRLPGLMAQAGLRQLDVATRSNCMGLGRVHDAFARASIRQIGDVMVKDGDITQAELDEMVALFDDPAFADVRSVFITVWGQKPPA